MRVQQFSSAEDTVEAFKNYVLEVFQSEWEKQIPMMVVHQNILTTVMLQNDKLSNGAGRLHLAMPEIFQTYCASLVLVLIF